MWIIVGLGNPGKKYADTRHNIGFMVIDELADNSSILLDRKTSNFVLGRGLIRGQEVTLVRPLTFMNRSGTAVRDMMEKHGQEEKLIVVHDDIDLPTGVLRIKNNGSAGGHNGVQSIIDTLGTEEFIRVRIGIGHAGVVPAEVYVLRSFQKSEIPVVHAGIERAVEAVPLVIEKGVSHAQNVFHS